MDIEEKKALYKENGLRYYTKTEEILHCITHGLPILYFVGGLIWMLLRADSVRESLGVVAISFFSLFVYVNSTLYHAFTNIKLKKIWRKIDHSGIPFMVLACGAPIAIICNQSIFNYIGLGISMAFAVAIVVLMVFSVEKFNNLSLILDFVIGAFTVAIFVLNWVAIPYIAKIYFIVGGSISALSGVWYVFKQKYMHVIFHVLCAVGPMLCFVGVWYLI